MSLLQKIKRYKVIRYILGGGLAALIDLLFLYIFTDVLGVYYIYSQIYAFCVSFLFSFFFQKYITFRDTSNKHIQQGLLFLLFQLLGLGINLCIMYILVDMIVLYYLWASIVAKWIVFFWNFAMNHYFNFKPQ